MEYALGNIFVREFDLINVNDVMHGHTHNFDHVTYVVSGRLRAKCFAHYGQGWTLIREQELVAGDFLLIEKDKKHEFIALEPNCRCHCIYAHRNPQSHEVVQDYNGWPPAGGTNSLGRFHLPPEKTQE